MEKKILFDSSECFFVETIEKYIRSGEEKEMCPVDTVMFIFWLVAAIALAVVEALTSALVTIWFVFGAILAMLGAAFGLAYVWQVLLFVLGSLLLLILTRPFAKKMLRPHSHPTNADRIVGRVGVVLEEINPLQNSGQIKILGQIWSAQSKDGTVIGRDENVRVLEIQGVKALVEQIKSRGEEA